MFLRILRDLKTNVLIPYFIQEHEEHFVEVEAFSQKLNISKGVHFGTKWRKMIVFWIVWGFGFSERSFSRWNCQRIAMELWCDGPKADFCGIVNKNSRTQKVKSAIWDDVPAIDLIHLCQWIKATVNIVLNNKRTRPSFPKPHFEPSVQKPE